MIFFKPIIHCGFCYTTQGLREGSIPHSHSNKQNI